MDTRIASKERPRGSWSMPIPCLVFCVSWFFSFRIFLVGKAGLGGENFNVLPQNLQNMVGPGQNHLLRFLCATSVFSVSLWCIFARNSSTTETQRTQRLHREERRSDF